MSPKFKMLFGALALVMITGSSFAAPAAKPSGKKHIAAVATNDLNNAIKTSFKNDFRSAEIMSWEVTNNFTKLTFRMSGNILFAFYSPEGELLAVSRNILSSHLPLTLTRDLKSSYGDYWISDLFEISSDNGNYYYVTLENSDRQVVLRSVGTDSWQTYRVTRKS